MPNPLIRLVIIVIAFLAGMLASAALGLHAQDTATPPPPPISTPATPTYRPFEPPTTNRVFEDVPGPDVPTLQTLTQDATTDVEGIAVVATYFEANRERLATLWRETNPTRLAGLYSMYVVHISHIYGETEYTASLTDYLAQPRAHCGTYSIAQSHIATALGLEWRMFELTSGWHGWIEIMVDGRWEIFDAYDEHMD
ncbi:MAG: hypothetical protein HC828_11640 [Blastochloris sp.]|nr:hypothetical protein [Blastochloris sp.]